MEQRAGKLEQWRNKTDQEKHLAALVGASALTAVVVFFWAANLFSLLKTDKVAIKAVEPVKAESPVSIFSETVGENFAKIKLGFVSAKEGLAAIFVAKPYINEGVPQTSDR